MKNRLIFKTKYNDLVSVPIDSVVKTFGSDELSLLNDESVWFIKKDWISIVDKELFPEEHLI